MKEGNTRIVVNNRKKTEMADKCEKARKLARLGEMYDLLKKLQKRGEYNNSKNILCSLKKGSKSI